MSGIHKISNGEIILYCLVYRPINPSETITNLNNVSQC